MINTSAGELLARGLSCCQVLLLARPWVAGEGQLSGCYGKGQCVLRPWRDALTSPVLVLLLLRLGGTTADLHNQALKLLTQVLQLLMLSSVTLSRTEHGRKRRDQVGCYWWCFLWLYTASITAETKLSCIFGKGSGWGTEGKNTLWNQLRGSGHNKPGQLTESRALFLCMVEVSYPMTQLTDSFHGQGQTQQEQGRQQQPGRQQQQRRVLHPAPGPQPGAQA